jgi:creatinine amidohydrolase
MAWTREKLTAPLLLEEMSWPEVAELAKQKKMVLIPVGSIEQHGPHLPLNCDLTAALEVSLRVARKIDAVVAPSIVPGVSTHHMPFPGTITLSPSTFIKVVKEYCASLSRHGFMDLVLVNGHGGNSASLTTASAEARVELDPVRVYHVNWWEFIPQDVGAAMSYEAGYHANGPETSWMLALRPKLVRMDLAKREMPRATKNVRASFSLYASTFKTFKDITKSGVLGDPTGASAEEGRRYVDSAVDAISKALKELASEGA